MESQKEQTLCAWCGAPIKKGTHSKYMGEFICKKCYMFAYKTKRKDLMFWKGVKANG